MIYQWNDLNPRDPYYDERPYLSGRMCKLCGQDILTNDVGVEHDRDWYHLDCLESLTTENLIKELGGFIDD